MEMAQRVKALTANLDDLSLIRGTHRVEGEIWGPLSHACLQTENKHNITKVVWGNCVSSQDAACTRKGTALSPLLPEELKDWVLKLEAEIW